MAGGGNWPELDSHWRVQSLEGIESSLTIRRS
jgi:hypothetical protein